MQRLVALIRGVNVGGNRKLPMAELRAACAEEGFADARTYIQSGNIVLAGDADEAESRIERLIERRFGFSVPVVARTAETWAACARDEPDQALCASDPNLVLCGFPKRPADPAGVAELAARATVERITPWRGGLAICYPSREAMRAALFSPALVDRLAGSPVTTRNWRTVQALAGMLDQ